MTPERLEELREFYADEPRHRGQPGDGPRRVADECRAAGKDPSPWERGTQGEVEVAGALSVLLGEGWTVLHSVPRPSPPTYASKGEGEKDVDHVVLGPAGVFSINTKNLQQDLWLITPDQVFDQLRIRDFGREALSEAEYVSARLSLNWPERVEVVPVIIAVNDRVGIFRSPELPSHVQNRVVVLPMSRAAEWLMSMPTSLDNQVVQALAFWASLAGVWRGTRYWGAKDDEALVRLDEADCHLADQVTKRLLQKPGSSTWDLYKHLTEVSRDDLERVLAWWPRFVETPPGSRCWTVASLEPGPWSETTPSGLRTN